MEGLAMNKLIDFKRDWLILAVCIVTIVGCLYFYTQAQSKVDLAIKSCNDYWQNQIDQKYGSIITDLTPIRWEPTNVTDLI